MVVLTKFKVFQPSGTFSQSGLHILLATKISEMVANSGYGAEATPLLSEVVFWQELHSMTGKIMHCQTETD